MWLQRLCFVLCSSSRGQAAALEITPLPPFAHLPCGWKLECPSALHGFWACYCLNSLLRLTYEGQKKNQVSANEIDGSKTEERNVRMTDNNSNQTGCLTIV